MTYRLATIHKFGVVVVIDVSKLMLMRRDSVWPRSDDDASQN